MIYSLFVVSLVISFVLFKKKQRLQDVGDDKRVFYYFVKNSLEFFGPLAVTTGLYAALLLFVSLVSGRAVIEGLKQAGHDVFPSDISPADLSALDHHADVIFPGLHGHFGESGELQEILEARHPFGFGRRVVPD